jgi:hypothetical protein
MSSRTWLDEDDQTFEQRLLGAGRAEVVPNERTQAALLHFVAGVGALQGSVLGAKAAVGSTAGARASTWSRVTGAAKWLALGAVGGGIATFVWLQHGAPTRVASAPPTALAPAASVVTTPPAPAVSSEPVTAAEPKRTTAEPLRASGALARAPAKPASDLAAEVTALDGIRTALAIGALGDAEAQLLAYRRSFARGALRSEAEVLAIDVLVAQGRKQAAARAAERFILQHPRDPQVARVRAFLE